MMTARHELAGALADLSLARLAYAAGDREDCRLTLEAIARTVEAYRPTDKDEAKIHRNVTRLLDRMIQRMQ